MCYHHCRTACFEGYCPSGWTWKRLYRISLRFHACPDRFYPTAEHHSSDQRNLDGIAPVGVAGVVGIKAVGRFARINTERRKRVRAAGIRRRCADIKRAAYAGDKSQCQSKAYAAFEFHGIFLLFLFCGAVERAAPAEKRLKIACVYHSSFAACCAVGHMKCPIFDTKYTDRKNRVNYA